MLEKFLSFYKLEREKKLKELDVSFLKALENDDTDLKDSIKNEKNYLRDFPNNISVNDFTNVDELKDLWPVEKLGTFKYNI